MRTSARALGAVLLGVALGCSETPEEAYREAEGDARAAREALQEQERVVEVSRERAGAAAEKLARDERELEALHGRLAAAEARLAETATDEVLFRSIQTRLLERFPRAAISARVEDGVVLLSGRVHEPALREEAEAIAAAESGVREIRNQIVVKSPLLETAGG